MGTGEVINIASIVISLFVLVISGVGVYISYLVAKRYGDVAGAHAARKFSEGDTARARITAIQSLLNEVTRIRKLADRNSQLARQVRTKAIVRMPVTAFETAFISGSPGLSVSPKLLDAVTDYLTEADAINSLIDTYLWLAPAIGTSEAAAFGRGDAVDQIKDICKRLSEILNRLDTYLTSELEAAKRLFSDSD